MLTERDFALCRIGDGKLLKRDLKRGRDRDLEDRPSPWFENAGEFGHCFQVIWDVFEDMIADNAIEDRVRKRNHGQVEAKINFAHL